MVAAPDGPLFPTCPKCGYARHPEEADFDRSRCPACGLVFAKWIRRDSFVPPASRPRPATTPDRAAGIADRWLGGASPDGGISWWGRALLWLCLAGWSNTLASADYRGGDAILGGSFMHAILLPIHEAGHVLFLPFGEFMTIAGGSLFQLLLPLVCAGALLRQGDRFGCAVGLWWTGTSLLDLAPYIYDAQDPRLLLLGGHTGADGPHDWIYLLGRFDQIQTSPTWGNLSHTLGCILMIFALTWGAAILMHRRGSRAKQR